MYCRQLGDLDIAFTVHNERVYFLICRRAESQTGSNFIKNYDGLIQIKCLTSDGSQVEA